VGGAGEDEGVGDGEDGGRVEDGDVVAFGELGEELAGHAGVEEFGGVLGDLPAQEDVEVVGQVLVLGEDGVVERALAGQDVGQADGAPCRSGRGTAGGAAGGACRRRRG
jgi:hypothetical protein